ncbi:MAG TPA: 5'-nucleotidase C-terminal domain-containing protein [Bacteroidales bacterium]|nr:5'-nucleotidase C-terminal domain-containing protein [Bacteroidales bacterium]
MKHSLQLSFALIILVLSACNRENRPDTLTIKIIETSDIHGAIFPYDLIMDQPSKYSQAQIFSYVGQERSKPDQEVILLDNGDILQGDPLIYYYNFEQTNEPHIVARVMNYMQYDAATVGNHDIEPGHAVYDKLNSAFTFPWLAANALDKATGNPYFKPYSIIEKKGVKVAVLGLITPAIPKWLPEKTREGIEFVDMIESARYWVSQIQEKENPDLLIGLFHSGLDYTYGNQDKTTRCNENASLLVAEQVPGFDVIFVGHDHKGWNKWAKTADGNEVLILGALNGAKTVTASTIKLFLDKKSNRYEKKISGEVVDIASFEPNQDFLKEFEDAFAKASEYVSKPVAELQNPISTHPVFFGDAAFTDLIHEVQLDITDADISFATSNSFDLKLDTGLLQIRDIFKFHRYENLLYTMELTGSEIEDYLEYSYSLWYDQMHSPEDHMLLFRKDSAGQVILNSNNLASLENPFWNFDSSEGIDYEVDISKPDGNRIRIISLTNGAPFDPAHHYSVALNSYRGNGGGEHLTIGAGISRDSLSKRIQYISERDLRWHTIQWLKQKGSVAPKANGNWKVIPELWVENAKATDQLLLFGPN